jgi:hypothetical protein
VQAIVYARDQRPSADTPKAYGAPALRSAGLSLSMTSHAEGRLRQLAAERDSQRRAAGPVALFAEEIAQGYRTDVWDGKHAR